MGKADSTEKSWVENITPMTQCLPVHLIRLDQWDVGFEFASTRSHAQQQHHA